MFRSMNCGSNEPTAEGIFYGPESPACILTAIRSAPQQVFTSVGAGADGSGIAVECGAFDFATLRSVVQSLRIAVVAGLRKGLGARGLIHHAK